MAQYKRFMKKIPFEVLEQKGFDLLGEGRHRQAFLTPSGKYVIKFPLNPEGAVANDEEAHIYATSPKKERERLAKCRLFYYNNLPCLIMEYVEEVTKWDKLPKWTRFIDCGQVGYTRYGQLVAFDYSYI